MVRVASVSVEEQASYWRQRFNEWPDEKLVRWVEGVARLKLRAAREIADARRTEEEGT